DLAQPLVEGLGLCGAADDPGVKLVDLDAGVLDAAAVAGWGEEEVDDGEVEGEGVDEDFLGVELSWPFSVPGSFDGGDAGLGEAGTGEVCEAGGEVFLGP